MDIYTRRDDGLAVCWRERKEKERRGKKEMKGILIREFKKLKFFFFFFDFSFLCVHYGGRIL